MPSVISFYSQHFSICLSFESNNNLGGIFVLQSTKILQFDIKGFYVRIGRNVDFSFFTDWKPETDGSVSYTAFSGSISPNGSHFDMVLDWFTVVQHDSEYPNQSYPGMKHTLSSDPSEPMPNIPCPCPVLEFTQHFELN